MSSLRSEFEDMQVMEVYIYIRKSLFLVGEIARVVR
jgi:hypothetical protein